MKVRMNFNRSLQDFGKKLQQKLFLTYAKQFNYKMATWHNFSALIKTKSQLRAKVLNCLARSYRIAQIHRLIVCRDSCFPSRLLDAGDLQLGLEKCDKVFRVILVIILIE